MRTRLDKDLFLCHYLLRLTEFAQGNNNEDCRSKSLTIACVTVLATIVTCSAPNVCTIADGDEDIRVWYSRTKLLF